jgi:hypothetical protein
MFPQLNDPDTIDRVWQNSPDAENITIELEE